jgi:hypothetical protein
MGKKESRKLKGKKLWSSGPGTITADNDLDLVLGSTRNLPLRYWRAGFFFFRAPDEKLLETTGGLFPAKLIRGKTHPVYALHQLPDQVGFKVCPCSSKRPFDRIQFRYIKKGCHLLHSNEHMSRNSFLVETVKFNIPPSMAYRLIFNGEVPATCLQYGGSK